MAASTKGIPFFTQALFSSASFVKVRAGGKRDIRPVKELIYVRFIGAFVINLDLNIRINLFQSPPRLNYTSLPIQSCFIRI